MHPAPRSRHLLTLCVLLLLCATGCAKAPPPAEPTPQGQPAACLEQEKSGSVADSVMAAGQNDQAMTCPDARTVQESERNRANCYRLQPGKTVIHKKGHRTKKQAVAATKKKGRKTTGTVAKITPKKGQKVPTKGLAATKKGKQKTGSTTAPPLKEEVRTTTGMCQPQSLIYARCRTGIKTCTMGDTSPVQWFACARNNRATTSIPTPGSVLVLGGNSGRKMPTGHPVYVEAVKANSNGTWTLRITHTNYDRKCHLDLDALVLFDPKRMTASFQSGPWSSWAKDLQALGFILR